MSKKTAPPEVLYCTQCGSRMHPQWRVHGYTAETGEPVLHVHFHCPQKKWYWWGHDSSEYTEEGNEIIHYL
jgi:hypothetical protein